MENPIHRRFFGPAFAKEAIQHCLSDAKTVRIATAFFEATGWGILADTLSGKEVRILVGREEGAADKVTELLQEFFAEIQEGAFKESPALLKQILSALRAGKLSVRISTGRRDTTIDARYLYHHAKLYIADRESCIVTSANFTKNGLMLAREAGTLVTEAGQVAYFADSFDKFFAAAESLTDVFIEALEELIELRTPEEVYLRSLIEIYGMPDNTFSGKLPPPAQYQKPVIARLVRSLIDFGGAFLVASTGLGKTVIAAHTVAILRSRDVVHAVIVFAPAGLKDMWSREMRAARVSSHEFSYYILSADDWKTYRDVMLLENELRGDLKDTLIILDESHHMRNDEDSARELSLRHQRIQKAIEAGAKLLMLTATPYSRGVDDINNQLRLLPQRLVRGEFFETEKSWQVVQPGELSELPPCTVLTAPTVVRHFSRGDAFGRRYVEFGNERILYFPERIHLKTIQFQNPFNDFLKELKRSDLLRRRINPDYEAGLFEDRPIGGKIDYLFEARLLHQFCSSPARVEQTLKSLSKEGGYERMRFESQDRLTVLAERLIKKMKVTDDNKFSRLIEIVTEHRDEKLVIFCIYRETAKELVTKLRKSFPTKKIESTVEAQPEVLENLLDYFAPIANGKITPGAEENEFSLRVRENQIDILVASEAISEGFNLQDARILVNYDLPWSILQLAQRMGRLMRPWHEPRELVIYNFLPDTMSDSELRHGEAWRTRLEQRNREHQSFAQLPVILPNVNEAVNLASLSDALQQFNAADLELGEAMDFIGRATRVETSGVLDDLAQITEERQLLLKKLRSGFRSRVHGEASGPALFLLIGLRSAVFPALFDARGNFFTAPHEVTRPLEILRHQRAQDIFSEGFDATELAVFQDKCLETWLREFSETREKIRVVCALHFG